MAQRATEIQSALLERAFWLDPSPVKAVAAQVGVTRQAVQKHAQGLLRERQLHATGSGRWRRYSLVRKQHEERTYSLRRKLTEDHVWNDFVRPQAHGMGRPEAEILNYGVSEMVNNAIDHSEGEDLMVELWRTAVSFHVRIADNGMGIFQKISSVLGLSDPRQSLLELGKGKFTTDPKRHTGEGVFFTSRAFDRFSLRSSELLFARSSESEDWLVDVQDKSYRGTRVTMGLLLPARRKLEDVFKKYSSGPEDYRFAKTHVPLKLATFGDETLLSRSAARRVLARVERFDEVLLDFKGVPSIGPAFADEIFRVFAVEHPKVDLIAINADEQVTTMIRRAKGAKAENENQPGLFNQEQS